MKIQLLHTYNDIIKLENLLLAWEDFIKDKEKKKDVQLFSRYLMDNIVSLIGDSYSCRIDKGTHKAINHFRSLTYRVSQNHTRTCWVLKCDIRKFFASISHDILTNILKQYIPDKNILELLSEVIESYSNNGDSPSLRGARNERRGNLLSVGDWIASSADANRLPRNDGCGLPLGNLTSQLFANIYLNIFDQFVKHKLKVKYYIRYADDFVILSHDKQWLIEQIPKIRDFLQNELSLVLHPNKLFIKTVASGMDFLGWVLFRDHRVLRTKTKKRMFARIHVHPTKGTLRSYLGLVKHGNCFGLKQRILALETSFSL